MRYKDQLFHRLKKTYPNQELIVDQPNELCFQNGRKTYHVRHEPKEETSFVDLEPANEYVLLKARLNDYPVDFRFHELHIRYANGEELLRFGVDEKGVLACKRYAKGNRTNPPSMGKITALLVNLLKEHPDYRLHALTQEILYQYYG